MPKCKYCGESITKFDKERCPFCGEKNPIDKNSEDTIDITQTVETFDDKCSNKYDDFKPHKKSICALLSMVLGIFSLDLFYLGFIKEALIRIFINALFFSCLFFPIFFLTDFKILSFVLPICCLYVFYIIVGFFYLLSKKKKDKKGVFLI